MKSSHRSIRKSKTSSKKKDFLVLYHGTSESNAQDIRDHGFKSGTYFTDLKEMAEYFGEESMNPLRTDMAMYAEPLSYIRDGMSEDEWYDSIGDISKENWQTGLQKVHSVILSKSLPSKYVHEVY
jgi:hypothetical protein